MSTQESSSTAATSTTGQKKGFLAARDAKRAGKLQAGDIQAINIAPRLPPIVLADADPTDSVLIFDLDPTDSIIVISP